MMEIKKKTFHNFINFLGPNISLNSGVLLYSYGFFLVVQPLSISVSFGVCLEALHVLVGSGVFLCLEKGMDPHFCCIIVRQLSTSH